MSQYILTCIASAAALIGRATAAAAGELECYPYEYISTIKNSACHPGNKHIVQAALDQFQDNYNYALGATSLKSVTAEGSIFAGVALLCTNGATLTQSGAQVKSSGQKLFACDSICGGYHITADCAITVLLQDSAKDAPGTRPPHVVIPQGTCCSSTPTKAQVLAAIKQVSESYNHWLGLINVLIEDLNNYANGRKKRRSGLSGRATTTTEIAIELEDATAWASGRLDPQVRSMQTLTQRARSANVVDDQTVSYANSIASEFASSRERLLGITVPATPAVAATTATAAIQITLDLRTAFSILAALLVILASGGPGNGNPSTSTTTTRATATTLIPPVTVTGKPTDAVVVFDEKTTAADYSSAVSTLLGQRAFIIEQITNSAVPFYALYADLYSVSLDYLDNHARVAVISKNIDINIIEAGGSTLSRKRESRVDTNVNNTTQIKFEKRAIPGDLTAMKVAFNSRVGSYPFHLQWMNSLWTKTSLTGKFVDIHDYYYESNLATESSNVPIYVMDTGLDMQHECFQRNNAQRVTEGWDCFETPCGSINTVIDIDSRGHGTMMASVIGCTSIGVNPYANLIPVKIGDEDIGPVVAILRGLEKILGRQTQNGKPRGIVNMSFNYDRSRAKGDLPTKIKPDDIFQYFLPQLTEAGLEVLVSAGNTAEDPPTENYMNQYSPQWLVTSNKPYIMVGSVDAAGKRSVFSVFKSQMPTLQYLSLYNLGEEVICAQSLSHNYYVSAEGTSHATAATSGLLSLLIAAGRVPGTASSGGAKAYLRQVAIAKKGSAWPTTEEKYAVPRVATDWEIPCMVAQQVPPAVLTWTTGLPKTNNLIAPTLEPLTAYMSTMAAPCVSVTSVASRAMPSVHY